MQTMKSRKKVFQRCDFKLAAGKCQICKYAGPPLTLAPSKHILGDIYRIDFGKVDSYSTHFTTCLDELCLSKAQHHSPLKDKKNPAHLTFKYLPCPFTAESQLKQLTSNPPFTFVHVYCGLADRCPYARWCRLSESQGTGLVGG